jgi:hypothetical protein
MESNICLFPSFSPSSILSLLDTFAAYPSESDGTSGLFFWPQEESSPYVGIEVTPLKFSH